MTTTMKLQDLETINALAIELADLDRRMNDMAARRNELCISLTNLGVDPVFRQNRLREAA